MKSQLIGKYPLLLQPDNFTPLQRTPWAGRRIGNHYKSMVCPEAKESSIGESWEFSCDPDFPSRLMDGTSIIDLITAQPSQILGKNWSQHQVRPTCEILVKLINASEPLSLQIHPRDDDDFLKATECGKPESWLVLDHEPGAGIYLGFNQKLSRDDLKGLLAEGDKAKEVLQFVDVKVGDYFEIEPGVPHAIGPGVTLLEPQRILFERSGKTYRFWDWGRRYDQHGRPDVDGQGRELHIEAALRLVDPEKQHGKDFVDSLRRQPLSQSYGQSQLHSFPSNPYYQLHVVELQSASPISLSLKDTYAVMSIVEGDIILTNDQRKLRVCRGHSLLLPASCEETSLFTGNGLAKIAVVAPAGSELYCRMAT